MILINLFFKKYLKYILLILLIFISYNLFIKTESSKLLKKELKIIKSKNDSLLVLELGYKKTIKNLKYNTTKIIFQKSILLNKFNKLNLQINNKIKNDEANISDIDNLSSKDINNILSSYKYTPFKPKN